MKPGQTITHRRLGPFSTPEEVQNLSPESPRGISALGQLTTPSHELVSASQPHPGHLEALAKAKKSEWLIVSHSAGNEQRHHDAILEAAQHHKELYKPNMAYFAVSCLDTPSKHALTLSPPRLVTISEEAGQSLFYTPGA